MNGTTSIRNMSRSTLCTPKITDLIRVMIEGGSPPLAATMAAGVSRDTYFEWIKRGRAALMQDRVPALEQTFATFVEMVDQAEGIAEASATMKALGASPAAALKHRFGTRALADPPTITPRSWMEAAVGIRGEPTPPARRSRKVSLDVVRGG